MQHEAIIDIKRLVRNFRLGSQTIKVLKEISFSIQKK